MANSTQQTAYPLDNDRETARLTTNHFIIKDAIGGLILAPVDLAKSPIRILDSATADGLWLHDLASSLPLPEKYTLIGTDFNPSRFPAQPPPGTSYHVQDINKAWPQEWHNHFDLVHQRLCLIGAGSAAEAAVYRLAELVRRGGWIQLVDLENMWGRDDGPAWRDFVKLQRGTYESVGADPHCARDAARWLREAGLVDVGERLVDCFWGASNADEKFVEQGADSILVAADGLVEHAKGLPALPPALADVALDTLATRLRSELAEQGGNNIFRIVWGRKPQ